MQTFRINNKNVSDPNVIAEKFCDYFTNIGENYSNKIPPSMNTSAYYLNRRKKKNPNSIFLTPTDSNEIITILKTLKSKKSAGHDQLSTVFLKSIGPSIAYPISKIINISLQTGIVPDTLKIAKVIPIHKGKEKNDFSNYRPISLLPSMSKLAEKVIHKRFYFFLETQNILYENQYGFRRKHGTIDALTKFVTDTTKSLDEKESILAVFLDLSKAFDTIDHSILLNKLEFYGIRGKAWDWCKDYLSNRKQYVNYKDKNSSLYKIRYGVPQGSVLSPLLFIIYTNDLPDNLNIAKSILFADDTTIYHSSSNISQLYETMNTELNNLTDWFQANKLSLNISKTNYMIFSNINLQQNYIELKITNQIIMQKSCVKFLGVLIDEKLKWNEHVKIAKQKVSRSFYAINRAKHFLPRKHLITLYYSLVYPYLNYGITLWGATYDIYLKNLILIQKKIVRIIAGASYNEHSEPLFKKLKLLKLPDIYRLQISKYVLSFLHHIVPTQLNTIFNISKDTHEHSTRHSTALKLQMTKTRTVVATKCISNMGPLIWNALSVTLYTSNAHQTLVTLSGFSARFKRVTILEYSD